jgi:hypothetical protein
MPAQKQIASASQPAEAIHTKPFDTTHYTQARSCQCVRTEHLDLGGHPSDAPEAHR